MAQAGFILLGILGISVLVIVHELGHYLTARWLRMRVERFSIGLGPTIFKYQPKGSPTTFQLCAIPFLAYVQVAGMNPFEEVDRSDPALFPNKSAFARMIVILGGPIANYLFSSMLVFGLVLASEDGYPYRPIHPLTVHTVMPGSPAFAAGIEPGDEILRANGEEIDSFQTLIDVTSARTGRRTEYVVQRGGEIQTYRITPEVDELRRIGVVIKWEPGRPMRPVMPLTIASVDKKSPAAEAGFRENDIIRMSNGEEVDELATLTDSIRERMFKPTDFAIERDGERITVSLTPQSSEHPGRIGIAPRSEAMYPNTLAGAAEGAFVVPFVLTVDQLSILAKRIGSCSSAGLSGPKRMVEVAADSAEEGLLPYLSILMVISVALGLFNLLPFPALDGGRFVFLAYEVVTRKRPNARFEALVHTVGIVFLLCVIAVITYGEIVN